MTENAAYAEPMNPDEALVSAPSSADADYTTGFDDYWGTDETLVFKFPDGRQFVTIKKMTEGERARFEKDQNQDLKVDREQNTTIKIDPGRTRKALLKAAVIDWFIVKRNPNTGAAAPLKFTDANLNSFIDSMDPKLVDKIEKAVRDFNPWLKNDLTVEEIDKEIENLQNEREAAIRRAAGE